MGSYTNKVTNENNLCKLPTYAQKLFFRDLLTSDSFILQPGKGPGAFFNYVTSPNCPRAGASFRITRGKDKSSVTMMPQHRAFVFYLRAKLSPSHSTDAVRNSLNTLKQILQIAEFYQELG